MSVLISFVMFVTLSEWSCGQPSSGCDWKAWNCVDNTCMSK